MKCKNCKIKIKKKINDKQYCKDCYSHDSHDGDALSPHVTVDRWERANGRGFWGNSSTGYINDKDL